MGGFPTPRQRRIPEAAVRAVGLFEPFTREFVEMLYQFKRPFVLDSSHTTATFGLTATDLDEALRQVITEATPATTPSAA